MVSLGQCLQVCLVQSNHAVLDGVGIYGNLLVIHIDTKNSIILRVCLEGQIALLPLTAVALCNCRRSYLLALFGQADVHLHCSRKILSVVCGHCSQTEAVTLVLLAQIHCICCIVCGEAALLDGGVGSVRVLDLQDVILDRSIASCATASIQEVIKGLLLTEVHCDPVLTTAGIAAQIVGMPPGACVAVDGRHGAGVPGHARHLGACACSPALTAVLLHYRRLRLNRGGLVISYRAIQYLHGSQIAGVTCAADGDCAALQVLVDDICVIRGGCQSAVDVNLQYAVGLAHSRDGMCLAVVYLSLGHGRRLGGLILVCTEGSGRLGLYGGYLFL